MNEGSRAGFFRSNFHDGAAIDGNTLCFSERLVSDDDEGLTKFEDVVDPPADLPVNEL